MYTLTLQTVLIATLVLIIQCQNDVQCAQEIKSESSSIDLNSLINGGLQGISQNADSFRLNIFRTVALKSSKSVIMSPYGIWSVLGLAYFGSEGRTRDELARALHLGSNKEQVFNEIEQLNKIILNPGKDSPTTVQMKDAAYIDSTLPLNECITKYVNNVELVNFQDPETTANMINNEFSRVTNGKIDKVLSPSDLLAAQFVLVNGIYFKGDWDNQFDRSRTTTVQFTDDHNTRNISQVQLMLIQDKIFNYVGDKTLGAHILEIPYKGQEISFYAFLPDSKTFSDTTKVLESMTLYNVDRAISRMKKRPVDVAIPKFKLTSELSDSVKKAVVEEGVQTLFTSGANLSSIVKDQSIFIDSLTQKSLLELNEEGTVAAAVSTLISVRSGPSKPLLFVCNRPFVFIIRHKSSRTTLFSGVVKSSEDLETID